MISLFTFILRFVHLYIDIKLSFNYNLYYTWGCSSVGRASALQAGGQEFDSPHLHQCNVD